jgi:hypothetical protein
MTLTIAPRNVPRLVKMNAVAQAFARVQQRKGGWA